MEIAGYPNYIIYEDGKVWSKIGKGRFLKPSANSDDYLYVILCNDGIQKLKKIHRLIALHYISNPENKPEVDHIDRDRQNNNIDNLRWATRSENNSNKEIWGAIKFKGVCKSKGGIKFAAQTTINGKKKHIGTYNTAEEASEAYNNYITKSQTPLI